MPHAAQVPTIPSAELKTDAYGMFFMEWKRDIGILCSVFSWAARAAYTGQATKTNGPQHGTQAQPQPNPNLDPDAYEP